MQEQSTCYFFYGCIRWGVDCSWARPKGRAARSSRPKATPSPPNDQQPISFRRPFSLSLQKKKRLACPPRLRPSPARCGHTVTRDSLRRSSSHRSRRCRDDLVSRVIRRNGGTSVFSDADDEDVVQAIDDELSPFLIPSQK